MFYHLLMSFRLLLLYLFIQFSTVLLWAETNDLTKVLVETTQTLKDAGTIDYKASCPQCDSLPSKISTQKPNAIYDSKENHQKISLSVLTPNEANALFTKFMARTDIPFRYIKEGCYARAHKMARIMDEEGIISGKAFLEGHLVVDGGEFFGKTRWGYHVASLVYVKKNNELIPTIFDPSLFNEPVPYSQWKALINKNAQTVITHEYFTNRFSYDFPDRIVELKNYKEEDLIDMELANKKYKEIGHSLSLRKKQEWREAVENSEEKRRFDLHTEQ